MKVGNPTACGILKLICGQPVKFKRGVRNCTYILLTVRLLDCDFERAQYLRKTNMSTVIATIRGIQVTQDDNGRVHWQSGAAIDADGANGQNGNPFAYRYPINDGLDDIHGSAGFPSGDWPDILVND
jgi:hypothetical protein